MFSGPYPAVHNDARETCRSRSVFTLPPENNADPVVIAQS